jgi:dephospho-CoA kinase
MMLAALTGNFGMGKSSVLSVFRDLGASVLDSDRIVAHLLEKKKVIRRIRELLGDEVVGPDGQLDKKTAAEKIFGDRELKKALETFLHPLVLKEINDFISGLKDKGSIVVVEVPLLFEGGYQDMFQKVITIHTTRENALRRLTRAGISREEALARLKTQLPIGTKKRLADYAIDNNGTRGETRKRIEKIYRLLQKDMKNQTIQDLTGPRRSGSSSL